MKKFDWDYVKPEKVNSNIDAITLDVINSLLDAGTASEHNYYMMLGAKMLHDAIIDTLKDDEDE